MSQEQSHTSGYLDKAAKLISYNMFSNFNTGYGYISMNTNMKSKLKTHWGIFSSSVLG